MDPGDRAWLERALGNWQRAERDDLLLEPQPLPEVLAIDARCTYRLPAGHLAQLNGLPHDGTVHLPGGNEAALGPISFASGDAGGYFAMSLPSVWREAGVTSEVGLERLMDGVLLHEIMHTRQTALANAVLGPLVAETGIPDDELGDDIVQQRFGDDPDYAAAWAAERDLLFAAAAAPDHAEARRLAARALERMRARHARWFTGDNAAFASLDEVFLTMEGMGQWLIWRYLLSPEGGGYSPEQALPAVRRGGRQWSQDEGLALILVVDRLLPGWQERAFRDPDWRATNQLAAAVAGS
jgi:hypothetical protein